MKEGRQQSFASLAHICYIVAQKKTFFKIKQRTEKKTLFSLNLTKDL